MGKQQKKNDNQKVKFFWGKKKRRIRELFWLSVKASLSLAKAKKKNEYYYPVIKTDKARHRKKVKKKIKFSRNKLHLKLMNININMINYTSQLVTSCSFTDSN